MARILALDYGKKRTGIAVTDPLQIIATGLRTVATDDLIRVLKEYFAEEAVEEIILGYPLHLDGQEMEITPKVKKLSLRLEKLFPDKKVRLVDERYTSKMAAQSLIDSGLKQKARRNKALLDEVSATILLQGYLQQKRAL